MNVIDKEMYHIHTNGNYDNLWYEGNELTIDDNYNSYYNSNHDIPAGVQCANGHMVPLNNYIDEILQEMNTNEKILKLKELSEEEFLKKGKYLYQILSDSYYKIRKLSIKNREEALEEVRKEKYPNLPSRYHSLWVCDENSLDFWLSKLSKDITLYKILLTGNLFKSSDSFLPHEGYTKEYQKEEALKYWNPVFSDDDQVNTAEYLFQGKIKILNKVEKNKNS